MRCGVENQGNWHGEAMRGVTEGLGLSRNVFVLHRCVLGQR